jgi:hypothetical protein
MRKHDFQLRPMHLRVVHQIQRKLVTVDRPGTATASVLRQDDEHMPSRPNGGVLQLLKASYRQTAGDGARAEAIEALGRFRCHA